MPDLDAIRYEDATCEMAIDSPARGVVVLRISGHDVGSFGEAPMRAVESLLLDNEPIQLFIDARETRGASIDVSGQWALWLRSNQVRIARIGMLTGSRLIGFTAGFVRSFAGLDDLMEVYSVAADFDRTLDAAIEAAGPPDEG